MKEGRYSQNLMRILVVVLVVAAGLWLPLEAAYGNSAEPPTVVWLMFEYQIPDIPRLLGVQLLGCQTIHMRTTGVASAVWEMRGARVRRGDTYLDRLFEFDGLHQGDMPLGGLAQSWWD